MSARPALRRAGRHSLRPRGSRRGAVCDERPRGRDWMDDQRRCSLARPNLGVWRAGHGRESALSFARSDPAGTHHNPDSPSTPAPRQGGL